MKNKITVIAEDKSEAISFAVQQGLPLCASVDQANTPYALIYADNGIVLAKRSGKKWIETQVDFVTGAKAHRRKFGGGNGQAIAKAVGLNKASQLRVIDATAGMGGDAFVLATLGCHVTMIERSPVVRLLLEDGLARGLNHAESEDEELFDILKRMHLVYGDSHAELDKIKNEHAQVVYLDPMFPERKKSAEVKKDMRFFHDIVGSDIDAEGLLSVALEKAVNRVVVKRPKIAPYLGGVEPGYQLLGKAGRFDIYPKKAF